MKIADDKSAGRAAGGVLGSDGFIAFKDALEAAAASRADVIVQPGGSTSDYTMIETANELGLVMFFTGERQFRH
jgi:phosphoribosylaminoimidazolecarboxamide formyltransferase/IMP cyclohydrolase